MSSNVKSHVFDSPNMIIVLSNIIFFMVVQTLFFKYVASKQFNIVLEDKANIVGEYLKHDPDANEKFRKFKNSDDAQNIKKNADAQQAIREKQNWSSTLMWVGVPLLIIVALLIFFIVRLFFKNEVWDTTDTMLLSFVVFAYMVEVFFYIGVVRPYQFYGDQSIYDNLYHKINERINKDPVTATGKQLDTILELTVTKIMEKTGSIDEVRKYFEANKQKFGGLDVNSVIAYAKSKTVGLIDSINFNAFDQIGKHT